MGFIDSVFNTVFNSGSFGNLAAFGNSKSPASYVPITLSNTQSSPTPSGMQQLLKSISLSSFASHVSANLSNIYFSSDALGKTRLRSWRETGAANTDSPTWWVVLPSQIPATTGTLVIYMQLPNNRNSVDGYYTGLAPNLPTIYGKYDNGSVTFDFYDNFIGGTLSAQWVTPYNITYSVNNGFTATATSGNGYIISTALAINPASEIVEFYGSIFQSSSNWASAGALDGTQTPLTSGQAFGSLVISGYPDQNVYGFQRSGTSTYTPSVGQLQTSAATAIFSIIPISSTTSNYLINYGNTQTVALTADTYPLYEGLISAGAGSLAYTFSNAVTVTWYRARKYPPSGVMPSVSVGAYV